MTTINMNDTIRAIVAYAEASSVIERATQTRTESRKIVAEFVRDAHGKEWKKISKPVKAAIDGLTVGIVADKVGLLGVIKTCCEYGIMPTTLNADRLRKAKTWTDLNGKIIPNGYGKVHTKSGAGQKAPKVEVSTINVSDKETEKQVDALVDTIEKQIQKEGTKKLNAIGNALALATMEVDAGQTPPKAPSVKATTPQKGSETIHPLTSNVSSSDAPISAREHCGILLDQLFKNDAFRSEFAPILAMCLDSNVATVTRCFVEARDAMLNGKGAK